MVINSNLSAKEGLLFPYFSRIARGSASSIALCANCFNFCKILVILQQKPHLTFVDFTDILYYRKHHKMSH
jgi:hypothetical protein